MFGRRTKEQSSFSEFVEHKTRLFRSKVVYSLQQEHEHYFSKSQVLNRKIDPRCKVCGILLSEFRTTKKFEGNNYLIVINENINIIFSKYFFY